MVLIRSSLSALEYWEALCSLLSGTEKFQIHPGRLLISGFFALWFLAWSCVTLPALVLRRAPYSVTSGDGFEPSCLVFCGNKRQHFCSTVEILSELIAAIIVHF